MRFLISVIDDRSNSGTEAEMKAVDEFNDKLEANDHWVFACGLADPKGATVFDNRADAGIKIAAPVNNTTEFQSGFWIISAESREQAEALAAEGSKACNRKVEVRSLLGG
mgnify:CR=1 FL=1